MSGTLAIGHPDRLPGLRLRLPATSANLGPAFDAAGLALSLWLTLEAHLSHEFSIDATGRDAAQCSQVDNNTILDTYRGVLTSVGRAAPPLQLSLRNEIPLGMGCGSSAAALLAGVVLADYFGKLGWTEEQIVTEASRREGHPDNVAACWYGGFTVSAQDAAGKVTALRFAGDPAWRMLLVMQPAALPTREARALLPNTYSRPDAVSNVQRTALLVAAFAQRRLDLLCAATLDRLHQPFREQACPLLGLLQQVHSQGIAAVTLSGAGPSVLVFLKAEASLSEVQARLRSSLPDDAVLMEVEIAGAAEREGIV